MTGFAIYPKWFWITLLGLVIAAVTFQPHTAAGYAVLMALLLPILRFGYLHPLSAASLRYFQWLKTVPYTSKKRLPHGSVHPGIADLLVVLILCISVLFVDKHPGPVTYLIVITSAVALSYSLVSVAYLFKCGPIWVGYVVLAFICVAIYFMLSGDIQFHLYWSALFPLTAFPLSAFAQWLVLKRFPWSHVDLEWVNNRGRLDSLYGRHDLLELGEPYTSLSPQPGFKPVRWEHRIGVSAMSALFMVLFDRAVYELNHVPTAIIFFVAIILRWHFYLSNKGPGGFWNGLRFMWQDIKLRRWTQNALLTIIILAGLAVGIFNLLREFSLGLSLMLTPVLTAGVVLAVFLAPPSRRQWDLTGRWQLRMTPMNYFTKPRAESLRLQKSE